MVGLPLIKKKEGEKRWKATQLMGIKKQLSKNLCQHFFYFYRWLPLMGGVLNPP